MWRLPSILLLIAFSLTGSGIMLHLHHLDHAHEVAAAEHDHGSDHDHGHESEPPAPAHDEQNCQFHAMLRAPIDSTTPILLLITLGSFVAFLTQLSPIPHGQRTPSRLDCRGPPDLA